MTEKDTMTEHRWEPGDRFRVKTDSRALRVEPGDTGTVVEVLRTVVLVKMDDPREEFDPAADFNYSLSQSSIEPAPLRHSEHVVRYGSGPKQYVYLHASCRVCRVHASWTNTDTGRRSLRRWEDRHVHPEIPPVQPPRWRRWLGRA